MIGEKEFDAVTKRIRENLLDEFDQLKNQKDTDSLTESDLDFNLDHLYGKGHNTMSEYISRAKWDRFPSREDILSGIHLMEKLSY